MVYKNRKVNIAAVSALTCCLLATACGKKMEADTGTETIVEETAAEKLPFPAEITASDFITVYTTDTPTRSMEPITTRYTDDWSSLMTAYNGRSYAYLNGNVYFRRYHEDSYEEGGLWADYQPIAGTKKEIVRIDADGVETELFCDEGYGNIYLVNERFYMTDLQERDMGDYSATYTNIYSVDMQGENRTDYGKGEICASDEKRNVIILELYEENLWEASYYALDCVTGKMTQLSSDSCDSIDFRTYWDGWVYFSGYQDSDSAVSRLTAISIEGEQKDVITLKTSEEETYSYQQDIMEVEVAGNRIYFIYGGYDGTAKMYQGGKIITVKSDGTDYRAIASDADSYYICQSDGKTLLYLPQNCYTEEEKEKIAGTESDDYWSIVWDVEANTIFLSDFPRQILYEQRTHAALPYKAHIEKKTLYALPEDSINIYALPDDSGAIIRLAIGVDDTIPRSEDTKKYDTEYKDLFYADGFVYFSQELRVYDSEYSLGWRDGYRRIQTAVYRLKLGEKEAELLYSY